MKVIKSEEIEFLKKIILEGSLESGMAHKVFKDIGKDKEGLVLRTKLPIVLMGLFRVAMSIVENEGYGKLESMATEIHAPVRHDAIVLLATKEVVEYVQQSHPRVTVFQVQMVLNSIFKTGNSIFHLDMELSDYRKFRKLIKPNGYAFSQDT